MIEVCAEGNWIIQVSTCFYPSLSKKVYYIKCLRDHRDTKESLCLPKINTKMPTRTKSVEIHKTFIDKILFRVLSDKVLFEFSVIGSSSGSTVIYSSLGSSVRFFRHVAIF